MRDNQIILGVDYNYIINPDNQNEEFLYEIIVVLRAYEDRWRDTIIIPIYNTYKESLKRNYNFDKMFKDIKDTLNEEYKEDFKVDDIFYWWGNLGGWFMVDYHNLEESEYFRDEVPIADKDIADVFDIEDIKEMFNKNNESKMTKEQILKEIKVVKEIEKEEGTLSKKLRDSTFYNMLLYYRGKGIEPKDVDEDELLYFYDYVNVYTKRAAKP